MSENTVFDDSLLDVDLDDLEDLPEFKNFPAGVNTALLKISKKVINNKPAVEFAMVGIESIELSDPTAEPIKAGDSCSSLFFLDSEFGRGALKKVLRDISQTFGTSNLLVICNAFADGGEYEQGLEVTVTSSITKSKKNGAEYMNIKNITVN